MIASRIAAAACAAAVLAATGASAQEAPAGSGLTLAAAVARGLERNVAARLAAQQVRTAEGEARLDRSGLLPDVEAHLSAARQTVDLENYGLPLAPGENPIVGPYNVLDARVGASQALWDAEALARARAGRGALEAARLTAKDVRERTAAAVAALYVRAAVAARRIAEVRAQHATAEALLARARALKEAGVAPGIDVLRAAVQEKAERQRVIVAETDFAKAKLALAQAIELPLADDLRLADEVAYVPLAAPEESEALRRAAARFDVQAAQEEIHAAENARAAEKARRLPSLRVSGDFGLTGPDAPSRERTYTVGAALKIPIFEAGRTSARLLAADARLESARARGADLAARAEEDVRAALLDVRAADERVHVAKDAVDLAAEQLRQARDRFEAGVADNLEVVQAQDAAARATDDYLAALYAHNLAKLSLARAVGDAETAAPRLFGGAQ